MATIYLVRHGQASFGAENYDKLSDLGCRQAQVTGAYFRDTGVVFDAVYSGDLSRQRETARLAIASQPAEIAHHIDPRFNEIENDEQVKYLVPEVVKTNPEIQALVDRGLSSGKDYQKVIEAVFNYWVSPACSDTRLASWADYSQGVREALADVIRAQGAGKTVGIFASGGTLATIVADVLGLGGDETYQFYEPVFNCSVTQLFYNRSKVSLSYYNDCSFLRVLGAQQDENLVTYR
ncbi:histidine phosphatase family protein [Candidatus Marimicrobium litorale]|uniref:Histidine phosphatase family protein n=1 Tax=Candidatus Marimicrobium litorale TaxID=2518991 RepID=A0ABT3TA08_9GAMM|nr:histidine phosphatase family protein [Candidatus Marimicrobium litorale]MCX2979102.1 histidine phosphatase family protein [Candidatus Marimicrobium litorale]